MSWTVGNLLDTKSSRVSSSVSEKNGAVDKLSAKKSDSAKALVPKEKRDTVDNSKYSKNEVVQVSTRSSDSSSTVMSKDRHGSADDGSHSNDAVSIRSSDAHDSSGSSTNVAQPQSGPSNTKNSSLALKSGSSSSVNTRRNNSNTQYKPEKWMLPDNTGDRLTQLNLAIVSQPLNFCLFL